jgi:hypothetical protein
MTVLQFHYCQVSPYLCGSEIDMNRNEFELQKLLTLYLKQNTERAAPSLNPEHEEGLEYLTAHLH